MTTGSPTTPTRTVFSVWWPLAGSWLLMGLEMPAFVAAASRLPNVEPNLAAFNSVVYPISMVVEGPIVMLLAASTALVRDMQSYRALRKFTIVAAIAVTLVHALIAFTPIYDFIALELIHLADEALEPGRTGLRLMLPWSAAIAYRRFQQGVLIRNGHSRAVVVGTGIRLVTMASVLYGGVLHGGISGVVVGASAISSGVIAEAIYAALRARTVVRHELANGERSIEPLTTGRFVRFYTPLALTPLITLAMHPITAAAIWRMPEDYRSSASWGAMYGFIFLFRALGFAFQEVVVSLADARLAELRRFALKLGAACVAVFVLVALTPASTFWFRSILDLPPHLAELAITALIFGALMPAITVSQHYFQGILVARHATRGITEAVAVYLGAACLGFAIMAEVWTAAGIYAGLIVLTIAGAMQLLWLWLRCRTMPRV